MASLPRECDSCPLAPTAEGFCSPSPITEHTRLVAWGEAPGATEIETGHGFTGESGRLLREWLRRAGLSVASAWPDDMPRPGRVEEVAFRNVVLCKRPGNEFPGDEEALGCLIRHGHGCDKSQETFTSSWRGTLSPDTPQGSPKSLSVSMNSPPPWIAFGANAVRVLTGLRLPILKVRGSLLPIKRGKLIERTETCPASIPTSISSPNSSEKSTVSTNSMSEIFNSERGKKEEHFGGWLIASLHPSYLVRGGKESNPNEEQGKAQDHLKPLLGADTRRALESSTPKIPRVVWQERPEGSPPTGVIVSVDIEGANGQPNIVGVSWDEAEAHVFPWSDSLRSWLTRLFETNIPTFHNANFDIPELKQAGVTPPRVWVDTINLAALYDSDQPMNLQTQVLTHVPGSVTWKNLVDHQRGPDYSGGIVGVYRELWTNLLQSLGREAPRTGQEFYRFYNGLDCCYGLALANRLSEKLIGQT